MAYISYYMQPNFNNNRRLYNGSNKKWCRLPVTVRSADAFSSYLSFYHVHHSSFCSNSCRAANKTRKIFFRSFRNSKLCRQFMSKLQKRYLKRFKQSINFKINIRGNKIEYYAGKKIWKKNIKISKN